VAFLRMGQGFAGIASNTWGGRTDDLLCRSIAIQVDLNCPGDRDRRVYQSMLLQSARNQTVVRRNVLDSSRRSRQYVPGARNSYEVLRRLRWFFDLNLPRAPAGFAQLSPAAGRLAGFCREAIEPVSLTAAYLSVELIVSNPAFAVPAAYQKSMVRAVRQV